MKAQSKMFYDFKASRGLINKQKGDPCDEEVQEPKWKAKIFWYL
jgi:hypothetical protein